MSALPERKTRFNGQRTFEQLIKLRFDLRPGKKSFVGETVVIQKYELFNFYVKRQVKDFFCIAGLSYKALFDTFFITVFIFFRREELLKYE